MTIARTGPVDQAALWNGTAGQVWVEEQTVLDQMFKPIEDLLAEAIPAGAAETVLDIGCGTGATTIAIARRLAAGSACIGVDVSQPMVAAARSRARREGLPAQFVCADAQTHDFAAGAFTRLVSRFGVMFFGDAVRAFANLRRAAADGAELRVIVWRRAEENPFMTAAERAAAPFVPDLPPRLPDAPGQFAFADRDRVSRILCDGGWAEAVLEPLDLDCAFPARDLNRVATRLGPLGRVLQGMEEPARARVVEALGPAFAPYVYGPEVRFTAALWMVVARACA